VAVENLDARLGPTDMPKDLCGGLDQCLKMLPHIRAKMIIPEIQS
jgi:hypothetical protein